MTRTGSDPPQSEGPLGFRAADIRAGAFLGKYQILRKLAKGGMAEVFLAQAGAGSRLVAIKRLHAHLVEQPGFLQMFFDEARIAARLSHPNVVQVLDVGEIAGNHYIAMEFLHGEDVHALIRTSVVKKRRVPVEQALHVILGLSAGLDYAHDLTARDGTPLELVHRDVSPQNVVVTYDGAVKLLDFGIAKSAQQNSDTRTGTLKGKVSYMSPEQCLGERLDRRSDIFSLGILMYELALGRKLYRGRTDFDVMRAIVEGEIRRPRDLDPSFDPGLEAVILRALHKHREKRFQTAREMTEAIDEVVQRLALRITPEGLQHFVTDLFSEKVEAWRRARELGKTLSEHLTSLDDATIGGSITDEVRAAYRDSEYAYGATEDSPPKQIVIRIDEEAPAPANVPDSELRPTVSIRAVSPTPRDGLAVRPGMVARMADSLAKAERSEGAPAQAMAIGNSGKTLASLRAAVASVPTMASVRAVAKRTASQRRRYLLTATVTTLAVLGVLVVGAVVVYSHYHRVEPAPSAKGALPVRPASPAPVSPELTDPARPAIAQPSPALVPEQLPHVAAPIVAERPATTPAPAPVPAPAPQAAPPLAAPPQVVAETPAKPSAPVVDVTEMVPAPAHFKGPTGKLRVRTTPRCSVTIDGQLSGYTPFAIDLPPGRHELVLANAEHAVLHLETIEIRAGHSVHKRLDLLRK